MPAEALDLYVAIDPKLPQELTSPAVAFGYFTAKHPGVVVYSDDEEAERLQKFYFDLISGRPFPLQLVTREVKSIASLVTLSFFMDRSLALHPRSLNLVTSVMVVSALKEGGIAHVDRDLSRLLLFLDRYYFDHPLSKKETEFKLSQALDWVRSWVLEGRIPSLGAEPPPPKILDRGTNGFVMAETSPEHMVDGVIELYRMGYLRGFLCAPGRGKTYVLAFKKSYFLKFDLQEAAGRLNTLEGGEGGWRVQERFLVSPEGGTVIPRGLLTEVFVRV